MNKWAYSCICALNFVGMSLFAQGSSMSGGSATIEKMQPLEKATTRELPKVEPGPVQKAAPKPLVMGEASYFYPGTIVLRNGSWVGGDNLLNLPKEIGLYVNIIKPEKDNLSIEEEALLQDLKKIFAKANIVPKTEVVAGQPPLPFFQVQILLYPIDRGYAAACEGRLFESVELKRFMLEPSGMAYQAVTWQKSSLVVSPSSQIKDQLKKDVEDIVQSFADRYQAFENIKRELSQSR